MHTLQSLNLQVIYKVYSADRKRSQHVSRVLPLTKKKLIEAFYAKKTGVKLIEGLTASIASKIENLRIDGLDLSNACSWPLQGGLCQRTTFALGRVPVFL